MLILQPFKLAAQINSATLTGTVTDASGAVIPDADVTVQNADTGLVRTTKSGNAGEFTLPSLAPGNYQVEVAKTGFATLKQTGVVLQVTQVANLNLTLNVAGTAATIEVNANTQAIETTNATLGTVIQQQEVVDLPLNGRQFTQLLELAPGTVPIDQSQNNGKQPNFGAGAPTPSVNGMSNRSNLFFVDGIFASNPFFSGFSLSPSIDAIQEFKDQTHSDQAEYGQSVGAIVTVVTKSGTNSFHGSVFEFFRNDKLDARNTFAPVKLPYRQNQFGGTFGGPILKNKLFFFANYEGGRQVQPLPAYYTSPSAAQRNGDFSGLLGDGSSTIIYDPATFNPKTFTESPFPGNMIPANRIDKQMVTFLNGNYPVPNVVAAGQNNLLATTGNRAVQDQGNIRIDYNVGARDLFFGRYSQGEAYNTQPSALLNTFTTGFNGKNAGINWIHTYGPTLVSEITVAYNSLDIPQSIALPVNEGALFASSGLGAGFTAFPGDTAGPQTPGISLTTSPGIGGYTGFWNGAGPIGPMYNGQIAGSVAKQLGDHSLKFGGSWYKTDAYTNWAGNSDNFSYKGTWNAACQFAASNPLAAAQCPGGIQSAGGEPVASMLLSLPNSASRSLGNSGVSLRSFTTGLFGQDSWKVNSRMTVNYGLRWDDSTPVKDKWGRTPTYNTGSQTYLLPKNDKDLPSGPLPAHVGLLDRDSIGKNHFGDFSPRLGVAYQLTRKTVLRAGVGRTFDSWALALQTAQQSRGGWPSGLSQNAGTQDLNAQGLSFKPDGTPITGENPFFGPPVLAPSPLPGGGLNFQDLNWQPLSSFQWNVEVQQDFGKIGTLSAAYVGSEASHVTVNMPYDTALPSTNAVKVFPDPIWGGPTSTLQSIGTSNYKALQARLTRAFANGLTYNASFTWSKSMGDGVCGDFYQSCIIDQYHLRRSWGVTSLNVPLIFTFNAVYQLPVGKGRQFLTSGPASMILGDWQVNGIFQARSGLPANYTVGDVANTGGGSQVYNIVGDPNKGPQTTAQWFNAAAFQVPANGTFGNAKVNAVRGPDYVDTDFSVFRDFHFTESSKLQFRAEFFNIFNHPNYSNPGCVTCAISSTSGQGNRDIQLALKFLF